MLLLSLVLPQILEEIKFLPQIVEEIAFHPSARLLHAVTECYFFHKS